MGFALGRLAVLLAPLALAAALFAVPADEARADSGHPGGIYPLNCAAGFNGDLAEVVHLLGNAHEIDVNARTSTVAICRASHPPPYGGRRIGIGWLPLDEAAIFARATIAATLIAAGAKVNVTDDHGNSPLYWAIRGAIEHDHVPIVSALLAAGAEVNAKDDNGWTPLHNAIHWGEGGSNIIGGTVHWTSVTSVVSVLIAAGADVNARKMQYQRGETPLHGAIARLHAPVVSMLLAAGAEVNAKDSKGDTPLSKVPLFTLPPASSVLRDVILSLLLAAGGHWGEACAGEAVVNPAGPTPPCLCESPNVGTPDACAAPSESVCGELTPPRFYSPMLSACAPHDECIAAGDCTHAPLAHDPDGWTAAITMNDSELVSHFIADHGQDPDADDALHLAARHSALGVAKLLLQRGANPDAADSDGDTPLHEVARLDDAADNVALVSLLLDKGADPNIRNRAGWRPLDSAYQGWRPNNPAWQARRKMMAALIAGGATWSDECSGGAIPNENYQGAAEAATYPRCGCPAHLSQRDSFGDCECPGHSHAQVNGRCLPKDSAQVELEIEKMRAELEELRALLAALNVQLTLAADGPPETLEEVAKQAEVAARGIARRRDNFLALARAGLAEADDAGAAPMLALSDTEATCRMLDGEVQTHSRTGTKICSGIDHNDTFCIVGADSAFPCVGFFRHVRRCNDDFNRPALDPFHCAAPCPSGLRARGAKCAAD